STPLPGLHESLGMLRLHSPHFEMHADGVVDRDLSGLFIWITIRLNTHVHPLQWGLILIGKPFHHVDRTGRDAREKEFASADLIFSGVIRDEMMCTGITDGATQRARAVAAHFVCQSKCHNHPHTAKIVTRIQGM